MTTYNSTALPELVARCEAILDAYDNERWPLENEIGLFDDLRTALALARQPVAPKWPTERQIDQAVVRLQEALVATVRGSDIRIRCDHCGEWYPYPGACPSDHSELAQARERIADLVALADELLEKYAQSEMGYISCAAADLAKDLAELDVEVAAYRTRLQS